MTDSDQLSLFPGLVPASSSSSEDPTRPERPRVRPWRKTLIDAWGKEVSPRELETGLIDLIRRDRELLRALSQHGLARDAPEIEEVLEGERDLVIPLILVRRGELSEEKFPEAVDKVRRAASSLELLRSEILASLDDDLLKRVLMAESRIRVSDYEIFQPLAELEIAIGEERGELVSFEPSSGDEREVLPAGILTLDDVDALSEMYLLQMRAEQEGRPLPARGGLRTLLRGIPVVWLDAISEALGVADSEGLSRKDRAAQIASALVDLESLGRVLGSLDEKGRELLTLILESGGICETAAITERFGSDEEDGWFWVEDPPTSTLGQVRLRGLVFVGLSDSQRVALIPMELRELIRDALGS